jgi:lipoprotein-releasing system ATP-binding protein
MNFEVRNTMNSSLKAKNISKIYQMPGEEVRVLSGIDFSLRAGESASIVGPSGSGKSSLLYILGALEPPTSGTVLLGDTNPYALNEKMLAAFRNEKIGFVFQDHHLLPQCNVLENVLVPTLIARPDHWQSRALELLEQSGLKHRIHHRPHELSGGEKQRVALVRALILNPELVLCDEPTGNLDQESSETVVQLLIALHKKEQNILIVVTHNPAVAAKFGFAYKLSEAQLQPA